MFAGTQLGGMAECGAAGGIGQQRLYRAGQRGGVTERDEQPGLA